EKEHAIWDVDKAKAIERLDWAVDLLKHTNFFRAFTASSAIPAIYIQQFRDTIRYDKIAGSYKCQLDEQWFDLSKDTLRDALQDHTRKEESHSYCDPEYKVHQADLLLLHKASTVPRWRHVLLLHLPNEELFWIISKLPLEGTNGKSLGCLFRMISSRMTFELRVEFIDEGVPAIEPRIDDEEAIVQKGKGKEKVGEEQATQVLINLQTPKKKNPAEQFIFQRRTPATAEPSGLVESSSLYAELGLTDSGTESDEEVSPEMNAQGQEEGHGGTNPGDAGVSQTPSSHVVHAGPNLDHMDLGIAEASSQPNTEQMDDEFTDTAYPKVQENLKLPTEGDVRLEEPASSARTLSSMKNLNKDLSFTGQFLVEKSREDEPEKTNTEAKVQSMVTVPILQDTSSVPLMTTPVIGITDPQSDSTTVPVSMPTTTETTIGQLEQNIADLVDANQALEERLDKQGNRIHQLETQDLSRLIREQTVEFIDSQEIDRKIKESVKEVVTASVQHAMRAPLRARFKDLPTSDMKEILLQRMLEENYDKGHEDHKMAYEALQKSIIRDESEKFDADKAEERTKKKSKQDSPKTPPGSPPSPPPPPPPSGASGASGTTGASDSAQDPPPPPPSSTTNRGDQSHSSAAPGSSKTAASTAYTAWITTTFRLTPAASSVPEGHTYA
ncbi:hypothetical protein Tco_1335550, partial [Tanacetum coccineum]